MASIVFRPMSSSIIACCKRCSVLKVYDRKLARRCYMTGNRNILHLRERGLIQQVFPEDRTLEVQNALVGSPQTVYCGFDPTADSLHVGNLLAVMALLHCQRAGHQAIAVIGSATSRIGDPSGRTSERAPLSIETIRHNRLGIQENILRIFKNHEQLFSAGQKHELPPLLLLDNIEWYENRSVTDFLCDVGRYFRMGTMLSRHSVETRLRSAEGMSVTEFLYQMFQAYDWLHLSTKYNCNVQIGGSDQLGNIVSGYELISRATNKPVYGLTIPLITNTAGNKLGKSAGNAVWLSGDRTSPFEFYQFFVRLTDAEVERYLNLFTFLSGAEIEQIMLKHKKNPENRAAQRRLADEVTCLVHGDDGLKSAHRCTKALYGKDPEVTLAELSPDELQRLFSNASSCELFLDPGTTLLDVVMRAKCFRHESDAVRVIEAGGVQVNGHRTAEHQRVFIPGEHILSNKLTLIRVGKKNYYIIKWLGLS